MNRFGCYFIILMVLPLVSCQTSPETSADKGSQNVVVVEEKAVDAPIKNVDASISEDQNTIIDRQEKPITQANLDEASNKQICKKQSRAGTNFRKQVCKTRAQWDKDSAASKEWTDDITRRSAYGS